MRYVCISKISGRYLLLTYLLIYLLSYVLTYAMQQSPS